MFTFENKVRSCAKGVSGVALFITIEEQLDLNRG